MPIKNSQPAFLLLSIYIFMQNESMQALSQNPDFGNNLSFYLIGLVFVLIGIAFFLIPLIARSASLSSLKIPWIILYVYHSDGFYFATSPLLIIISLATLLLAFVRR
jgi:hypothetical protein